MAGPKEILEFWFDPRHSARESRELWFGGSPETDALIRARFERDVLAASRGELGAWEADPSSCLALVLLLDQFPLNIYRDRKRSFEINEQALPVALRAIGRGFDQKVKPIERVFYYLPLEHSEHLPIQREAVKLFEALAREAPASDRARFESFLDYARRHLAVIERFRRFPDRNPVWGRPSTPEEQEYLDAGGPDF